MLDERWGDDEQAVASGLRAVLERSCGTAVVRAAEAASDGRQADLERALEAFGLWELPPTPELLAAVAVEFGHTLAPVEFIDRCPQPLARLLDAARLVGAAEGLLAIGVDYAKRRHQFGKPIGAFQAIAHQLADAATAVDGAALLVRKAAWVFAQDGPNSVFDGMCGAIAVDAARLVVITVHQVMGGYGFAMEEDCQLFSRRVRAWALRMPSLGPELADVARKLLDSNGREGVRHLWHHDHGVPLPRWAAELDALLE